MNLTLHEILPPSQKAVVISDPSKIQKPVSFPSLVQRRAPDPKKERMDLSRELESTDPGFSEYKAKWEQLRADVSQQRQAKEKPKRFLKVDTQSSLGNLSEN